MTRRENSPADGTFVLSTGTRQLPGPLGGGQGALADRWGLGSARLRVLDALRRWERFERTELDAHAGRIALGSITAGVLLVVVFASAGSSVLVPRSAVGFPVWEAGPLHLLFSSPGLATIPIRIGYSVLVLGMTVAYGAALLARRALALRAIWAFAIATALLLLLAPPLQLNDVWNYLGYARLGALHHLNPYSHVIEGESNDPIFAFTTWHELPSPYGPLFTALTYPLALLPIPLAYWLFKTAMVGASLAFLWTVAWCARSLGRDPRSALIFVAANPIYIFYEVGGFHNDLLMLLPSTGALAFLLARRDRSAGAALMLGVAVKLTVIVLLPFLLIAARPPERRLRVLAGCVFAGVALAAMDISLFGFSMPNIAGQSSLVTGYSIPNLAGLAFGLGGTTTGLVRLANICVVLVILWGLRQRDWVSAAGWATIALIASIAWLMPWYIVWALPLAALARSRRLRRVALGFTVFLILTFAPEMPLVLGGIGINPMGSESDQAAVANQQHLQGN